MLLSVPLTMIAKITMRDFEETRWIAALLSGGIREQDDVVRSQEHGRPPAV